ncbi:MAG: glycosyltransferase [Saprospirales bacterium]|jgi:glycosyltransferase involved in cell wall biosynthesis|nr:MAG: glycosyltransferase [Saprospirales bacterium]
MKILQLCKKFPLPLKDGESIAVTYLSRALNDLGCEVTLLAMNTSKHYINLDDVKHLSGHYKSIHTVDIDNAIKPVQALKNLFSSDSYHVSRFRSDAFSQKLEELLKSENYDIVQLETLYLAPYMETIRRHSDALVVMRSHNIEHEIWDRITHNTRFLPKKWYIKYLSKKLKNFELGVLNDYDFLVPISQRDLQKFRNLGYMNGARTIPIGIDFKDYNPNMNSFRKNPSVSFIGSLDWIPNYEGINWFLNEVWPDVHEKFPELELHIAGRNTPDDLYRWSKSKVLIHGEVRDAREFINQHPMMIVPLLSGSGMRAKILEGMALGKVVITTSMGLEGIEAQHNEQVLVADSPEEYLECFQKCLSDTELMINISKNAQKFVSENFNNYELAKNLIFSYKKYMKEHGFSTSD